MQRLPVARRWQPLYDERVSMAAEEAAVLLANGGTVRSFPPAKQAQKLACFMCTRATDAITLTGFTLDLLVLCEALKAPSALDTAFEGSQHPK